MENKFKDTIHGAALSEFADSLVARLLNAGFIVHRYDAHSTGSIYLKLDFGVCNSIRISDHAGKRHLKYRYNIGPHIKKESLVVDKWLRRYYPMDSMDKMLSQIKKDRQRKKEKYGELAYQRFMKENKKEHAKDMGFWSESYCVSR